MDVHERHPTSRSLNHKRGSHLWGRSRRRMLKFLIHRRSSRAWVVSFARPAHRWHATKHFRRAADSEREKIIHLDDAHIRRSGRMGGQDPELIRGGSAVVASTNGARSPGYEGSPSPSLRLRSSWLWRWCFFSPSSLVAPALLVALGSVHRIVRSSCVFLFSASIFCSKFKREVACDSRMHVDTFPERLFSVAFEVSKRRAFKSFANVV